jgi:V/A-type H+-transporting ATPase subunit A
VSSEARITWISGAVLRARPEGVFRANEALHVGPQQLLGEVIRVSREELVAQVYEETSGLRPGHRVTGLGAPMSAPLGPYLLGNVVDGLLRPLLSLETERIWPGMRVAEQAACHFVPCVRPGQALGPGMPFGHVELQAGRRLPCLSAPQLSGKVLKIAGEGLFSETEEIGLLDAGSAGPLPLTIQHAWPIRTPRPVAERLGIGPPMITGQRILDGLFPIARGGRAGLPGGFGTGKTVLLENLAKWCDADIIVYVGCGERGNELAGVLHEFPELQDPTTGRALMERTLIIANTSNMPVAAREASIYSGITVAEYFRDLGLHVALMADSTSRWAEALREVSGRLGELPGEAGYPAYLSSRIAGFYERAGRVRTLQGTEGSVTIMGAVSPPSDDFSEPVTIHTRRYIRTYWALDRGRAQARFFPAVHPLHSYSDDAEALGLWWQAQGHPQWQTLRKRFLKLLGEEQRLERMVRIVGRDALPPDKQLLLLCAELIGDAFLRQSAFSPIDRYASPQRMIAMMRLLGTFIDRAEAALAAGVTVARIGALPVLRRLQRMGEEIGDEQLDRFEALAGELDSQFFTLTEGARDAG